MNTLRKSLQGAGSVAGFVSTWLFVQVASASPAGGHGEAAGGHGAGITWFNWPGVEDQRVGFAYLIINFLVLAFLIHRLIIRKLVADNAARHDTIKTQVTAAQQAMAEAESVLSDYKRRVDRLDQETREILEQARVSAETDRQRLIAEARTEVERFKAQAQAAIQREVQTRRQEVEAEVLDRAISRAEALLRARFTDADQVRMVDDYAVEVAGGRPQA